MRFDVGLRDQSKALQTLTLDDSAIAVGVLFDVTAHDEDRAIEVLRDYLQTHSDGEYGSDVNDYVLERNPRDKDQMGRPIPESIRVCS